MCTSGTEPSLTFDLSCRLKLMLDETKLSPTSVSINTTNQMRLCPANVLLCHKHALNGHKPFFMVRIYSIAKIKIVFSELHVGLVCPMDFS